MTGTRDRCMVDGCQRPVATRGRCHPCYKKALYHGQITKLPPPDLRQKIRSHSHKDQAGCWIWNGLINRDGYGRTNVGHTKLVLAHRLSYEVFVGPVPDGLELDHLCRVRRCVNPCHLEPVTGWENRARGAHPSAHAMRANVCIKGHPFTSENTYIRKNGSRSCRACSRSHGRRYREKVNLLPDPGPEQWKELAT